VLTQCWAILPDYSRDYSVEQITPDEAKTRQPAQDACSSFPEFKTSLWFYPAFMVSALSGKVPFNNSNQALKSLFRTHRSADIVIDPPAIHNRQDRKSAKKSKKI